MIKIKFRGKRPLSGKWIYGFPYIENDFAWILSERFSSSECSCEVLLETVGQFTGLYDKNNKEIYKDDIVKCDTGIIGRVIWDKIQWAIEYRPFSKYEKSMCRETDGLCSFIVRRADCFGFLKNTEVIGNITDNPELLK